MIQINTTQWMINKKLNHMVIIFMNKKKEKKTFQSKFIRISYICVRSLRLVFPKMIPTFVVAHASVWGVGRNFTLSTYYKAWLHPYGNATGWLAPPSFSRGCFVISPSTSSVIPKLAPLPSFIYQHTRPIRLFLCFSFLASWLTKLFTLELSKNLLQGSITFVCFASD